MARCRCAEESACLCVINPGPGVTLTGTGAPASPWFLSVEPTSEGTVTVADTVSVDMQTTGRGSAADPLVVSARAIIGSLLSFLDNNDVDFTVSGLGNDGSPLTVSAIIPRIDLATVPPNGQVLAWQNGQYVPGPPVTAAPGAIFTGAGVDGDGSSGAPLRIDLCSYAELKAACA